MLCQVMLPLVRSIPYGKSTNNMHPEKTIQPSKMYETITHRPTWPVQHTLKLIKQSRMNWMCMVSPRYEHICAQSNYGYYKTRVSPLYGRYTIQFAFSCTLYTTCMHILITVGYVVPFATRFKHLWPSQLHRQCTIYQTEVLLEKQFDLIRRCPLWVGWLVG